jgi:acetolactate synthase-1/2/3 large subunit
MQMKIDVPVVSDARAFLREFNSQLARVEKKDRRPWLKRCKEWQARYPVALREYWNERGFVNDYVLLDVLSDELSGSDLLIPGSSGACSERTMQGIRVKAGLRVFNSQGFGAMGFGIPAAIGGCLASGRRRTVCIEGDGGFVMNIQELETVKRLRLPIKFFVLNNGGYGSIQATQRNYFGGHYVASTRSSGLTLPDLRAVSAAFGIPSVPLSDQAGIRERVREILATPGPVVCEVSASPDLATAPRVSTRRLRDGSLVSMPMEDLWPFLDREEFRKNLQAAK